MHTGRVRAAFAWSAVALVVASIVAFAGIDAAASPNYRGLESADSADLLALAANTDPVLANTYGLPLAVRDLAPGATLVVANPDSGIPWLQVRLAGLAGLDQVHVVDGSAAGWAEGADLDANVVASGPRTGHARAWAVLLDPDGDNDTLVLLGTEERDFVVSAALLPAFSTDSVSP